MSLIIVTGKYKIETFNFKIFLIDFHLKVAFGSSSKIVEAPKDKGPNNAYV